jgi:NADPH:quinone reductase-like Zn-dependent oxidoreductase
MALTDQAALAGDATFQGRVLYALLNYVSGTVLAEAASEVQSLAITGGTPASGAFVLSGGPLLSQVTVVFNETAGSLQAKMLAAMDAGTGCVCLGGPLPGAPVTITFTGSLADSPQGLMATSGSTLSVGAAAVTRTTTGVGALKHADRVNLGSRVIRAPESYRGAFAQMVTTNATVMADYTGGGNAQAAVTDAHIATAVAAVFNAFLGA